MTEYFHPAFPKLYRLGGEYLPGLARLFGAQECHGSGLGRPDGKAHNIVEGKCTRCGVHTTGGSHDAI